MRTNPFEGQIERLARTLTEQFGVTVLCRGDNACTDGKRILLPSLPEPMDEPLERMIVGYLDLEMGHVAYSDFEVLKENRQQIVAAFLIGRVIILFQPITYLRPGGRITGQGKYRHHF